MALFKQFLVHCMGTIPWKKKRISINYRRHTKKKCYRQLHACSHHTMSQLIVHFAIMNTTGHLPVYKLRLSTMN